MSHIHVKTTINGDATEFLCQADETLLDVLRDRLDLWKVERSAPPRPKR